MKIKGSSGISFKLISLIGFAVFAVITALRFYHTFALTDGTTGYFTENNITVILMYVLLAIGIIGTGCLCFICGDLPTGRIRKKVSYVSAAAGFLFGAVLIYTGLKSVFAAGVFGLSNYSFPLIKEAFGGVLGLLNAIFAISGGVVIIVETLYAAGGKEIPSFMKLFMLIPVLWAFCETLGFFSVTVSYVKVSQLFFAIFSVAFLMLFLFENARMTSDIGRKEAVWCFYATGIIAAGISFAAGLPYLVAAFAAPEKVVSYCPFELYNIAGGIYCVAAMLRRVGVRENEDDSDINTVTETL
ncbi:MAG: hypothetical protein E7573_09970 [Ruminococcaceae bacterium]|nr:hypothetical protein [Oscillospiraceae bacterium]